MTGMAFTQRVHRGVSTGIGLLLCLAVLLQAGPVPAQTTSREMEEAERERIRQFLYTKPLPSSTVAQPGVRSLESRTGLGRELSEEERAATLRPSVSLQPSGRSGTGLESLRAQRRSGLTTTGPREARINRALRPEDRRAIEGRLPEEEGPRRPVPGEEFPFGLPLDEGLRPFGYDFFEGGPVAPLESLRVTIDGDYRIGPGDAISVHVYSKLVDETFIAEVDRNGRITVPGIGEFLVTGQRYGDLDSYLKSEVGKVLKDVEVSVNLVKLRTFQVFVAGEVRTPGPHAVNALGTVITALMAAGGPRQRGSLRRVRLKRRGKTVATIDYYDLLLSGRDTVDPRLEPGDLIFVPVVGRAAAITGMVKRPGIYELEKKDTLFSLIEYAGGLAPSAYPKTIHIERTKDQTRRHLVNVLAGARNWKDKARKFSLLDGDVVRVPTITTTIKNSVFLRGNVERPGEYELRPGMRVNDLLALGERLLPGTYMLRAEILRTRPQSIAMRYNEPLQAETIKELIPIDLAKARKGDPKQNIQLEALDELTILHVRQVRPIPSVRIVGEVFRPGTYELVSGMHIRDLIFRAGNVKPAAHLGRAELTRRVPGEDAQVITVDLSDVLANESEANLELENFDVLSIQKNPALVEEISVVVEGEVRFPGTYLFGKGERLSSLLKRAGGFTDIAFPKGAIFTREAVKKRQEEQKERFVREQRKLITEEKTQVARLPEEAKPLTDPTKSLEEAEELLEKLSRTPASGRISLTVLPADELSGTENDLVLEDGDRLVIPPQPSEIAVSGEVYNPGSFLYQPRRTMQHYLELAGGLTRRAFQDEVFVVRADGTTISAAQFRRKKKGYWDGRHLGAEQRRARDLASVPVERGDALYVPPDFRIKRDKTGEVLERIFKLAVSIGTLSSVFR